LNQITGEIKFKIPQKREKPLSLIDRVKYSFKVLAQGKEGVEELTRTKSYSGTSSSSQLTSSLSNYFTTGDISFDILEKMRKDGVVKAGLVFKKAPVLRAIRKAKIVCEDKKIEAFLEKVFLPHLYELALTSLKAFEFGISFHEKVFKREDLNVEYENEETRKKEVAYKGYALTPYKYKFNHPMTISKIETIPETQEFNGYVQTPNILIPFQKAFVFAVNDFNSLWGESELIPTYPYWFWKELITAYYMRYLEKRATPPMIGMAPVGKSYSGDNEEVVDNLNWLAEVASHLRDGMTAVFPAAYDEGGRQLWDLKELSVSDRGNVYRDALDWSEAAIFRSLLVPDKPISQMLQVGSYSLANVQFEAFLMVSESVLMEFLDAVEKDILKQLVELNFGANAPEVQIQTPPLSDEERARYYDIFKSLLVGHPQASRIDLLKLAEELGIPVTEAEEATEEVPEEEEIPEEEEGTNEDLISRFGGKKLSQKEVEKVLTQLGTYLEKVLEEEKEVI